MNPEPITANPSSPPPRIVAFTKDWDDVPTCTTHVLRHMGRTMPVLWIESIGTRRPSLTAGKDIRRVFKRIRRALAGATARENQLRVLSPLVLPKTESRFGRWVNRRLMRWQIGRELKRMGGGAVEYWCFVPNAVDLLPDVGIRSAVCGMRNEAKEPTPGPSEEGGGMRSAECGVKRGNGPSLVPQPSSLVIYYCVDDWSKFHNLDGGWLAGKEDALLRVADVVFTPARYLAEKCRRIVGDRAHYTPHGVDYAAFARALEPATRGPDDMALIAKPVVGFYGNIHPWIDFALIEQLARARPGWSFVLIGEIFCDVSRLAAWRNVHFLGRREHRGLPEYCRAFDAAMIPYDVSQARMESVNPVKTRELLAAGVPIVAADVPELRGMGKDVLIARTPDEWIAALETQMARADRAEISRRVAGEDWSVKVREMRRIVEEMRNAEYGVRSEEYHE